MTRILVLGAGRVGGLIARDLAAEPAFRVVVADRSEAALGPLAGGAGITPRVADLGDPGQLAALVVGADLVVGAVPGALGHRTLRAALEASKPIVDISFFPEDPADLDRIAREHGVPAVMDCGVAPGLSNVFAGRSAERLDRTRLVRILVGGLPFRRVWPYEYRSVFSPSDVIEEYTRPSRMRAGGREVVRPALSGVEPVDFEQVGTLEAFYTDGLRTLLHTIPADTLEEKTLRYPGHADRMRMLRDSGFFDDTPLTVGDVEVVPRALSETLLFRQWMPEPGEQEFTLLRVVVEGTRDGREERIVWTLFDRTDPDTGSSSMARTTGFPCAVVARMLADGSWTEPGLHPPEALGRSAELTERLLAELDRRGVRVRQEVEDL